jgi:hypothetical protein
MSKPYAVFLSYNDEDRKAVESLAVHLADNAKLPLWFDRWTLVPGEPWVRNMERGLADSLSCAVFVGKSGAGPWQTPEVETALRQQVRDPNFRVIPVLLPEAPQQPGLPPFLSGNTWVDFRGGLTNDDTLWRLECGIRGTPPGRGRPQLPAAQPAQPTTVPEVISIGQVSVQVATTERAVSVFISYRHQEPDRSLAHACADVLEKAGHKVFIDTGIRWGANWVKEIQEALKRSDYLLVLLSPEAAVSEMVTEEVALARELAQQRDGTPIILPIRVRFLYTKPLPYLLSASLRTIHQESWSGPEDTSWLVGRLLATIATQTGWPVALPSVTPSSGVQDNAPLPHFDPRDLIIPGGSLDIDSRFYILREADEEVFSAVRKPRAMVTVQGPRQTGRRRSSCVFMLLYIA